MEVFVFMFATLCGLVLSVSGQTDENCNGRIVSCFANPCSVASCPGVSNAECVPNFCNRCSATFVVNGFTVSEADCEQSPLTSADHVIVKEEPILVLGGAKTVVKDPGALQRPNSGDSNPTLGGIKRVFSDPASRDGPTLGGGKIMRSGSGPQRLNSRNSPLLAGLFGRGASSRRSGSQAGGPRTPPVFQDIVSRISNWQPMDANSRNKMEDFLGGLLNKVFSRLG